MAKVQIKINGVDWELETDTQKIEVVSDGKINVSVCPKKPYIGDEIVIAGLKWTILDITDKGYVCLADKYGKNVKFDSDCNNWSASDLRSHLNTEFFKILADAVGEDNIIPFERDLLSLDGQTEFGTCEDKVSLLNVDEYRKYRSMIPNADYWWWLVTPWSTPCNGYEKTIAVVSPRGYIYDDYYCNCIGVRPFCIFSSVIFESEDK